MAVDESSSQDSTLIDDDLVAALGFEPVTTTFDDDATNDSSTNGDGIVVVPDDETDLTGAVSSLSDVDEHGNGTNGFALDELTSEVDVADAITLDEVVEGDLVEGDGVEAAVPDLLDAEASDGLVLDDVDALADDALANSAVLDEQSVDDAAVDDAAAADLAEAPVDEVDERPRSFFDLDSGELDADEADAIDAEGGESDLATVPSIASDDVDEDATAPVGLVDLDALVDDEPTDDSPDELSVGDLSAEDVAVGEVASEVELIGAGDDVIDLDVVDVSDIAAEPEVQGLADADSVFADATPVLDPPTFDDRAVDPPTETIGHIEPGALDLDVPAETVGTAAVATAATATPNKRRRRLRARKSRRVIRHIDPWSVLTFSVLFHMVVFAALLLSSVLVWNAAIASGMVENVESFIQELGDYETFEINADVMFKAAIVIAGMLTLASSVLVVLLTVVFNLISDLVGGIRVTVIEEETVRVPIDKKRSKARNE